MRSLCDRCAAAEKLLRRADDPYIRDGLYYILPRLKDARGTLRGGDPAFCDGLCRRLRLGGYAADYDGLRSFLNGVRADDDDVRRLRYYLILIYAELLCSGERVLDRMRAAEELDFEGLILDCSPLEARLLLFSAYRISDPATRALYRRELLRQAKKKRTDPVSYLDSVPEHRLTSALFSRRAPAYLYAALLAAVTTALFCAVYAVCDAPVAILALIPLYALASYICARVFARLTVPRVCPRVVKDTELPPCLIVRTALLDSHAAELSKSLLSLYHTEKSPGGLCFGLLADLPDSDRPGGEPDDDAIKAAGAVIDELNEKYGGVFFLFYRRRRYSFSEDAYIAPERKRGAVCELVRQLKTGSSSLVIRGDASKLTGIPYIITLDSDTLPYPGCSVDLIRCAAHPANRPVIDHDRRVVVSGHGILQPRIGAKLCGDGCTPFSRAFSADSGLQAYHGADFDVFGAVYGRGSFCGKGLINVSAFYECCVDVFPDGVLLSHDAIEGCRCRCGAVTDVVLYEDTPKNALSYFNRLGRWVRGDVQALSLTGRYLRRGDGKAPNGLRAVDRFILYNSAVNALCAPCAVLCMIAGLLTGTLPAACAVGLSYITVPLAVSAIRQTGCREALSAVLCYAFMRVSFIFREASVTSAAVFLSLSRLITRKRTLQWTTASAADARRHGAGAYVSAFIPSAVFGAAVSVLSAGACIVTGSLLAASPLIALLSSKVKEKQAPRVAGKSLLLTAVADHMKYFDDLVNAEHGYLPPDNYQVFAGVGAAPRTSPTDVGLYLLSVVASADLGLYGAETVYDRIAPTLRTLIGLGKKNGLLYNWYDTHTGAPLTDAVSTVDCGNYLASLITLRAALHEYEPKDGRIADLYETLDALIGECDLSPLYDGRSGRFRITDVTDAKYDLYCSEMHTTDILSVALGFAPSSHMGALMRPVVADGERRGVGSWSGSAFEYFMPALFLPSPPGSAAARARDFAAYRQFRRGGIVRGRRVYGTSESCYFAFDFDTVYQYKAHGDNGLSLCPDSDELVISPYSSFLMLGFSRRALPNLKTLKDCGVYGKYGFYEALDLTRRRVGHGYAVIKCFMAHHIGMSVVAAANELTGGAFVRRFCSDERISAIIPLLCERFPHDRPYKKRKYKPSYDGGEAVPATRTCAVLTNTVCTAVADGYGAGLYYKGDCVCDESSPSPLSLICGGVDLVRHPVSFGDGSVAFRAGGVTAALSVCRNACAFVLDAECGGEECTLSFDPVLTDRRVYNAHRAYSSLFVVSERRGDVIRFRHRGKGGFCISVAAFCKGILPLQAGTRADLPFYGEKQTVYGACVFPRLTASARAAAVRFVIGAGPDFKSSDAALFSAADCRILPRPDLPPVDESLLDRVLSCIMRPAPKQAGGRGDDGILSVLYRYGISGDRPVILADGRGDGGQARLRSLFPRIASVAVRLLVSGIAADTVLLYDGDDGYYNGKRTELLRHAGACGLSALIGSRVFIVNDEDGAGMVLSDVCVCRIRSASDISAPGAPASYPPPVVREAPAAPVFGGGSVRLTPRCTFSPMSYIYANPSFGALVTDRDGGFCWFGNSRMYALTEHATVPGYGGERLYFEHDGIVTELYSQCRQCRFYAGGAEWRGISGSAPYVLSVAVDDKMPYKTVRFTAACGGVLRLCCVPVLGERRINGSLRFLQTGAYSYVSRAYGSGLPSLFIHCEGGVSSYDGRTLQVCTQHGSKTVFTVGAAFSHTAAAYAAKNAAGTYARYAARVARYLSPFTLHGADPGIDAFFNVHARYAALFCRQFARCGFSQNGGAYGFRDQLQDCLCTVYGAPELSRAHILRCAAHQYEEGDVMHWFHPLTERGVRTRCSDDMLWLPYAVSEYVRITGDRGILGVKVRYICSPPLDGETDRYEKAVPSDARGTVLEHCERALSRLGYGEHGLCLTRGGDWNDGMNEAGAAGRGESVWLSLFAAAVMRRMSGLCGDPGYERIADALIKAVEDHGFDGVHYIRGYLDDGSPYGKTGDGSCEIDVLPQSFAAMLGLDRARVASALDDVWQKLYDRKSCVFRLLSPPFDGQKNVGYITSYPPGIRENGGQYTHGAVWGAAGFFAAGMSSRGFSVLRSLCPANICRTAGGFIKYGREPYALCGDVYDAPGLEGAGGWSFYTGAAGWYFNTVLTGLLGYREHDGGFEISPAFCSGFSRFTLTVKRHGTEYVINAENAVKPATLDGVFTEADFFVFDGGKHTLDIGVKK